MIKSLVWKLLERFGVQTVQFILQIILARLLDPEHYGMLSIMIIFINLANIFIQNGFNTSLIQNKDVTEEDYSSVFWVTLLIAVLLYILLFFTAPLIGELYDMPELITPFRVLSLMLIPGAYNSVQLAKVTREMDFKQVFFGNIGGIIISGIAGVAAAVIGCGLWALVIQTMLNVFVACIVMTVIVKWRPRFVCNFSRVNVLFAYGWKLLVSALLDTGYNELRNLVVGKRYDSAVLGYYSKGKQFPQFLINGINGAVQSVMLPAMSEKQDNKEQVKNLTRNSIILSSYIIFPMMAGLAAVASPLIELLLTEKWLECVPYLQIYCFTFAFWPVHTSNLQAINAMGRSDIFLKLEIVKKIIGVAAIVIAVVFFDTPVAIAMTGVFSTFLSCFINAYPNKKLIGYSYFEQMKDILPTFLLSLAMLVFVTIIGRIEFNPFVTLCLQIISGSVFYFLLSFILKIKPFVFLINNISQQLKK